MTESLRAVDIIAAKRDRKELSRQQIEAFIKGYASGDIPDYQASAWSMAVFLNGMNPEETGFLTRAMIDSGDVINLSEESGPYVDKHSTGGVGDKISLILAPLAAACDAKVPMMSGRALGHTGGTLDKLDSIPGYSTALTPDRFRSIVESVGYAMTGQSEKVVPADRKLYALRDVTATVESIPLITASILSKKFAEGSDALVMDVKCGSGAFMKTLNEAEALAESLVNTGSSLGKKVFAVITDMSEPLGRKVGNFLEVEESIDCLEGNGPEDVMEITYNLTSWMLVASGRAENFGSALDMCRNAISDGSALNKFLENVKAQGGDPDKLMSMRLKSRAAYSADFKASASGVISGIDAFSVGMAGVHLGVGRNKSSDPVEALAGIELFKKIGESVKSGDTVMRLWAEDSKRLQNALERLDGAVEYNGEKNERGSLILKEITS